MHNAPTPTPEAISSASKKPSWLIARIAGIAATIGSAFNTTAHEPSAPEPAAPAVAKASLSQMRLAELEKELGDPLYKTRELASKELAANMDAAAMEAIIRLTRHGMLEVARRAELLEKKLYEAVTKADRAKYYYKADGELPWLNFPPGVRLPPHLKHLEGADYADSEFHHKEPHPHAHFPYPNAYPGWKTATKYFLEHLADYDYRQSYFVTDEAKEMFLQRGMMRRKNIIPLLRKREQRWHQEHPPAFREWRLQLLPLPPLFPEKGRGK